MSYNQLLVLQALANGCGYGLEVMARTRMSSGTVYPILRRLEAAGLIRSVHEDAEEAFAKGRPARRLHELTEEGASELIAARNALIEHQREMGLLEPHLASGEGEAITS